MQSHPALLFAVRHIVLGNLNSLQFSVGSSVICIWMKTVEALPNERRSKKKKNQLSEKSRNVSFMSIIFNNKIGHIFYLQEKKNIRLCMS